MSAKPQGEVIAPHRTAAEKFRDIGCEVIAEARGWPDLLVRHTSGQLIAVEVKCIGDRLRPNQHDVLEALGKILPVYVLRLNAHKSSENELWWDELKKELDDFLPPAEYFGA